MTKAAQRHRYNMKYKVRRLNLKRLQEEEE